MASPRPSMVLGSQTSPLTLMVWKAEAEVLVDVEDQAAAEFEVIDEVAFALDEVRSCSSNQAVPTRLVDVGFAGVVGFGVGVSGIVGDDGGAAVEEDAAWIGEGAEF